MGIKNNARVEKTVSRILGNSFSVYSDKSRNRQCKSEPRVATGNVKSLDDSKPSRHNSLLL